MNEASEGVRGGGVRGVIRGWSLAGVSGLGALTGCFHDAGPGMLCEGASCVASSGSTGGVTGPGTGVGESATEAPTSTGASGSDGSSTGAPVDPGITMRLDSMQFVDPHLFLVDDTDPNNLMCTADITEALNGVLGDDIEKGNFNLLVRFEDYPAVQEIRLVDGDCEPPATAGAPWVCTPSDSSPAVLLGLEAVDDPLCRDIDPLVYAADSVPMLNDPGQPCMRTHRGAFSLAISGSVGALDLREAQFVASLDDAVAPTRLVSGLLYGFLPQVSAENLTFELPIYGPRSLWSVIDVPVCQDLYPTLLPSVDTLQIKDTLAPGVWLAINFTAERVVIQPAP